MSLADALDDDSLFTSSTGAKCTTCDVLESLTDNERTKLVSRISNHKITAAAIARVLNDHGVALKSASINRHRRGECRGTGR